MYKIHQLINTRTGEIIPYNPALANQVLEIAKAIKEDRKAQLAQRLRALRPRQTRHIEGQAGESLAQEFQTFFTSQPTDDIPF